MHVPYKEDTQVAGVKWAKVVAVLKVVSLVEVRFGSASVDQETYGPPLEHEGVKDGTAPALILGAGGAKILVSRFHFFLQFFLVCWRVFFKGRVIFILEVVAVAKE